jgi:putative acetyltransferase
MREITIREETKDDRPAVREVNQLAFESIEEPDLVDALSALGHVVVSLVAEAEGEVVGHILFSKLPIDVGDRVLAAAALAPMAVKPGFQREGIGSKLVRAGLERCRELEVEAVVVLGHPDYYPRFGFSAELAENLRAPFEGDAFMALELTPGVLEGGMGIVRYAPPFGLD